jgi:hypothetical protein
MRLRATSERVSYAPRLGMADHRVRFLFEAFHPCRSGLFMRQHGAGSVRQREKYGGMGVSSG